MPTSQKSLGVLLLLHEYPSRENAFGLRPCSTHESRNQGSQMTVEYVVFVFDPMAYPYPSNEKLMTRSEYS